MELAFAYATICLCALAISGCASSKASWNTRQFVAPDSAVLRSIESDQNGLPQSAQSSAEVHYAQGVRLEKQGSPACINAYAIAAQLGWGELAAANFPTDESRRDVQLYGSSVGKLITTAQQFGRLDPSIGVRLSADDSPQATWLPVRLHEIHWDPSEIATFECVGEYKPLKHVRPHRQSGLGARLLTQTKSQREFTHADATSAATAIVRPVDEYSATFVLDIINPLRIRQTSFAGRHIRLATDITVPLAYLDSMVNRQGVAGLLRPASLQGQTGLKMIEPYQHGKIPVIFIHGLASDPLTWGSMANDVLNNPDILEKFQFWTFSYPTGEPFPVEAGKLRQQLVQMRNHLDPDHADAALDNIVLIGHSMGGLVTKMQIASSRDELMSAMYIAPLEELSLNKQVKSQFASLFQFDASPQITRAIFIGTPHQGSNLANGLVSQIAAKVIRQPDELKSAFDEVLRENERLLTTNMRHMPNSIDLLRPDNPLLKAIYRLPVSPRVTMHSIYGVGHGGHFGSEKSDGVVPASSARHPGVASELAVDAGHSLHHDPATTNEVTRILRLHASRITSGYPSTRQTTRRSGRGHEPVKRSGQGDASHPQLTRLN